MKLLSYIIKYDTGFVPNPFWDYCTLAVCTHNHINAQLERGDWILGHSDKANLTALVFVSTFFW
jgi:hypothetical protein